MITHVYMILHTFWRDVKSIWFWSRFWAIEVIAYRRAREFDALVLWYIIALDTYCIASLWRTILYCARFVHKKQYSLNNFQLFSLPQNLFIFFFEKETEI